MKFGRTYRLTTYSSNQKNPVPDETIAYPMTLKFQVANNFRHSPNTAHFMIYNLSESTRSSIYRDIFDLAKTYKYLIFEAGYESEPTLATVFKGDIRWAYSYRQGPDWITEIDAWDGGHAIQQSQVGLTVTSTYGLRELLKSMVSTMEPYGVSLGAIGAFTVDRSRGIAVSGVTWNELVRLMAPLKAQCFINKGLVYILNQNEYMPEISPITELSSDSGLIGTPRIQDSIVMATMIFEPRIEVGQILNLKTDELSTQVALDKHLKSKVVDISHTGTISGAVGGDALTTVTFYFTRNPVAVTPS